MFCMNCGNPIPKEAAFCPCCGKPCIRENHQPSIPHEPEIVQPIPPHVPEQMSGRYAAPDNSTKPIIPQPPERSAPPPLGFSAGQPGLPIRGPFPAAQYTKPPKRKMPKWAIIAICAVGAVLLGVLILLLVNIKGSKPSPASSASAAPVVSVAEEISQPKEGECLYEGNCSYLDIDNLKVSFILSANKSYIYDVKFELTNLNASYSNGNKTTNLKISSSKESFSGQYPVDYKNGTSSIKLGASTIKNLHFDGVAAWLELDYAYVDYGTGAGSQRKEIPFGTTHVEMTTDNDIGNSAPPPAENSSSQFTSSETVSSGTVSSEAENTDTIFDESKLKNWNEETLLQAVGTGDIRSFKPKNPVPMYYIVCTKGVYDPVTGKESEGGYDKSYARHLPISTDDLLLTSGNLEDGGLTLTDDPNKATYALILDYSYENNIGSFHFGDDDSTIPQYHATLDAELLNLVTGNSIFSETIDGYATYANESVYTSMLNAAKGKQLYGGTIFLSADDFEDYWDFVKN